MTRDYAVKPRRVVQETFMYVMEASKKFSAMKNQQSDQLGRGSPQFRPDQEHEDYYERWEGVGEIPNSRLPQLSATAGWLSNMPTWSSQPDICLQTANVTTVTNAIIVSLPLLMPCHYFRTY